MSSWFSKSEVRPLRARTEAHALLAAQRERALAYLEARPRDNLLLMEMVAGLGGPTLPSEAAVELLSLWQGETLVGVASLRPSVVFDVEMGEAARDACLPHLAGLESGLIKSSVRVVTPLWRHLRERGRRALIDREEVAYALLPKHWRRQARGNSGAWVPRRAERRDLDALVFAARASLREEGRPDPFDGDPVGFRRWVRDRLGRARVIECEGSVVFVGYADVRRQQGWLLQGIYTWPEQRRRGFATAGLQGLVEDAFAAHADHVQLAAIEDNQPAIALYEGLGFEPFSRLRTILFV